MRDEVNDVLIFWLNSCCLHKNTSNLILEVLRYGELSDGLAFR